MRKRFIALVGMALVLAIGIAAYQLFWRASPYLISYRQVQLGMTVDEVRDILGPGVEVPQREVPGVVRAVNPAHEERPRRAADQSPTAREFPAYIRPVVRGDHILRWENHRTGERILVAFQDGKVCEKDYFDPNYF